MKIINVDAITSIIITNREQSSRYVWLPLLPEKRKFFGLMKSEDAYPAGFYEFGKRQRQMWTLQGGLVETEELLAYNYVVDAENIAWKKPNLKIKLDNGDSLVKYYNTLQECDEYAHYLQSQSRNTFEIIE